MRGVEFRYPYCTWMKVSPMAIRNRVLVAYGNACSWCGATTSLEIDHVEGGGNQHRKAIGITLEKWLVAQHTKSGFWPVGYQLLCVTPAKTGCHDRKSGRTVRMSKREGFSQVNVQVPDDIAAQLSVLAVETDGSKSKVIEQLVRSHLEGSAAQAVTDSMHQHLSVMQSTFTAALEDIAKALLQVTQDLHVVTNRLASIEAEHAKQYGALLAAFQRLKPGNPDERRGIRGLFSTG